PCADHCDPGTDDVHPGTDDINPDTNNLDADTDDVRPGTDHIDPDTYDLESGTDDPDSDANDFRSDANHLESGADDRNPASKTPSPTTALPTMIPLVTTAPVETVSPDINKLIENTPTPSASIFDNGLFGRSSAPPGNATTVPPNEETVPPNDHSDNLNRGKTSGDSIADLKAKATVGTESSSELAVRYV
ncbi:hypothetical protein ACHHYP_16475, partial [Achlya hypogyna]